MAGNPCNIIPDQEIVLEGGAKLVPAPEAADAGKVLGVVNASGDIGWVVDQGGTLVQQQSNWAETDNQSVSFIQNKPDLSVYATTSAMNTALAGKQDVINDLSDIRAGAALGATAAQPSDLPSSDELVPSATSGDEGKVLTVDNQGNPSWVTPSAGTVYTAGDGVDITNNAISADVDGTTIGIDSSTKKIKLLATIPTKTSDLQNDSGFITSSDIPAQVNADWTSNSGASEILNKPDLSIYAQSANLATVATTGDYDDLVNKPSIPAAQVNSDWNSSSGVSQILNKPSLAAVATTGDYNDLSNKPSIPAAQVNADWNANTGVAEILNKPSLATVATTGAYSDLTGTPTIPSVDQTYNASSTNAQSGTAVAGAIAGVNQVPASTSSDENKVLTVNSSGNPVWAASSVPASKPLVAGSNITITDGASDVTISATDTTYTAGDGIDITGGAISADVDGTTIGIDSTTKKIKLLSSIPTVDQTYSAVSTNAQSGVAVAEAIAAIPSYTAGDGIDITSNEISVIHDTTIAVVHPVESVTATSIASAGTGYNGNYPCMSVPSDVQNWMTNGTGTITIHIPGNSFKKEHNAAFGRNAQVLFGHFTASNSSWWRVAEPSTTLTTTQDSETNFDIVDEQDIVVNVPYTSWVHAPASIPYITVGWLVPGEYSPDAYAYSYFVENGTGAPFVFSRQDASVSQLSVAKPVPASTSSDENKVLTVNSSGNAVWASAQVATVDQTYNASSVNAQSGTAVAGALATVNQVPASTSADQDKVLTVNSSGTPVWAVAQGGGGGGSEFPYDPGYMHTGWNKMIVRFGDTSYDPTAQSSASSFTSITALSDPGVYEYTFSMSYHSINLFENEWNDIANNPVDILQITGDEQLLGDYYSGLFKGCTGLRSVWNIRGYFGSISNWFYQCYNLEVVSGHIPERLAYLNQTSPSFGDFGIKVMYNSQRLFSGCSNLKKAETIVAFTYQASSNSVSSIFENCSKLQVGAPVLGYVSNAEDAYKYCSNMTRLYGLSDLGNYAGALTTLYNPSYSDYPSHTCTVKSMFSNCSNLRDLNGLELNYGKLINLNNLFDSCGSLEHVPALNINDGVNCSCAFYCCSRLKEVPLMPYDKVANAGGMFSNCLSITDVTRLLGLATACTNVSYLLNSCWWVVDGCLELYTALQASSAISSYSEAFANTGINGWNDVRSQIPSSWGGTGA